MLTGLARPVQCEQGLVLVPGAGIEPARPKPPDFKSGMSTNFIIRALLVAHCKLLDS